MLICNSMKVKNPNFNLSRLIPDSFVLGLMLMILLAYFIPNIGMTPDYAPFNLKTVTDYGVILIFLFYGLKLNKTEIVAGLNNWPMHLSIQAISFLIFPALVLTTYPIIYASKYETLWLGVFYLSALPSTVSSSVVMVSIARGNIPGAIFNASISGIIGIFMTPLWIGLFINSHSQSLNFQDTLLKLAFQIILPVGLGLVLQPLLGFWIKKQKHFLATFDKVVILLIVYQSFSQSFESGIFKILNIKLVILLSLVVVILFLIVLFISNMISSWLKFNREDRITVLFCSSKKSLIHGSVMASILFSNIPESGLLLLPIMIYHTFQLFYISVLAKKYSKESKYV